MIEIQEKNGRKIYKGRHWVASGGLHLVQRTKNSQNLLVDKIEERVIQILEEVTKNLGLLDVTIKIFPNHFNIFGFLPLNKAPIELIENSLLKTSEILKNEFYLEDIWDAEYILTGIDNLDSGTIDNTLRNMGLI